MKKKIKLFITSLVIVLLFFLLFAALWFYGYLKEQALYNGEPMGCGVPEQMTCLANNTIIKDAIPCKSDDDCKGQKAIEFCYPSYPSFTDCIGEVDFCGKDGFCKQCQCGVKFRH